MTAQPTTTAAIRHLQLEEGSNGEFAETADGRFIAYTIGTSRSGLWIVRDVEGHFISPDSVASLDAAESFVAGWAQQVAWGLRQGACSPTGFAEKLTTIPSNLHGWTAEEIIANDAHAELVDTHTARYGTSVLRRDPVTRAWRVTESVTAAPGAPTAKTTGCKRESVTPTDDGTLIIDCSVHGEVATVRTGGTIDRIGHAGELEIVEAAWREHTGETLPDRVWIRTDVEEMRATTGYVTFTRAEWDAMSPAEQEEAIADAANEAVADAGGYGAQLVDASEVPAEYF